MYIYLFFFFFNDTATPEIYTLSLHDALPISPAPAPAATPAQRAPANDEHARLSPAVRKLAAERGIDPTTIQGSGLGGRVTREDVLAASAAPAAPARAAAPAPPSAPAKLDGARE